MKVKFSNMKKNVSQKQNESYNESKILQFHFGKF